MNRIYLGAEKKIQKKNNKKSEINSFFGEFSIGTKTKSFRLNSDRNIVQTLKYFLDRHSAWFTQDSRQMKMKKKTNANRLHKNEKFIFFIANARRAVLARSNSKISTKKHTHIWLRCDVEQESSREWEMFLWELRPNFAYITKTCRLSSTTTDTCIFISFPSFMHWTRTVSA